MDILNTINHKRVLFIHHSTGGLLLRYGNVRRILRRREPDVELWDHAYNLYQSKFLSAMLGPLTYRTGLSDGRGKMTGNDFNIIISNNSPKQYADIFSRKNTDPTLKQILEFDLIIFKNCFPTSNIVSDTQLSEYKLYYSMIFKSISRFTNKFILFTQPPLRREMTNPTIALRAKHLAEWMRSQESQIRTNISIFDFFGLLADKEGDNAYMLKRSYCSIIPFDSHPNIRANTIIGPLFVNALIRKIQ